MATGLCNSTLLNIVENLDEFFVSGESYLKMSGNIQTMQRKVSHWNQQLSTEHANRHLSALKRREVFSAHSMSHAKNAFLRISS